MSCCVGAYIAQRDTYCTDYQGHGQISATSNAMYPMKTCMPPCVDIVALHRARTDFLHKRTYLYLLEKTIEPLSTAYFRTKSAETNL